MSDFTLYWNIISQPSRAVKSLIDIGKLSCSLQNVNIAKLEQRKKEFTDMYSIGKVPVMKSGDFVLGESGAIMIYICERYPQLIKYYGETLEQRAITNQYISWYQNFFRPFMVAPVRLYLTAAITQQPIYEHQKKTHIDGLLDVIEKFNEILAKNKTKFIAGDRLTIADLLFFHEMTNMVYLGLDQ
jgi:glutathione S-transferase